MQRFRPVIAATSAVLATTSVVLAIGCGGTAAPAPAPGHFRQQWALALAEEQPERAFRLMTPELQRRVGWQRFEKLWREHPEEREQLAAELDRSAPSALGQARVPLGDGATVGLVLERGHWKLDGDFLDAGSLRTPYDAIQALRRALRSGSLDALMRVLSREHRSSWQATLEQTLDQTRDPDGLEIQIHGDEAVVHTATGRILLRREAGQWRVAALP